MTQLLGRRAYSTRSDRIVRNVMPNIILIDDNIVEAHFLAFMQNLTTVTTPQEKFTWDIDVHSPTTDTLSAAVTSTTQTVIQVSNVAYFLPNELWQVKRTDEVLMVKELNVGTGNISVKRAVSALEGGGGTAAATMVSGDQLNKISSAVAENSTRQVTRTTIPSEVYNYAQKFRKDLSMSDRQIKRKFDNGGSELDYQRMKETKEFRMDLNRAFLFNQRGRYSNDSSDDITLTGGIRPFITTNVLTVDGTLYKSAFDEFLFQKGMRYGNSNKMMFASGEVMLAFSQMLDNIAQFDVKISGNMGATIGTSVLKYKSNKGNLMIVEDQNITDQHPGEAYIVDMHALKIQEFSGNGRSGAMKMKLGTQDPDDDGSVDTFSGDMGLSYGSELFHAKITGVDGGSFSSAIV
jgi:hypothetical protein